MKIQPFKDLISARTKTTLDDDGIPMVKIKRALNRIGGNGEIPRTSLVKGAEWELLKDVPHEFQHVKAVTMEYHDFGFDHVGTLSRARRDIADKTWLSHRKACAGSSVRSHPCSTVVVTSACSFRPHGPFAHAEHPVLVRPVT